MFPNSLAWSVATALVLTLAACTIAACQEVTPDEQGNDAPAPGREVYQRLHKEMTEHLKTHIVSLWYGKAIDEKGGFHQFYDNAWKRTDRDKKSLVYQSRLTWLASRLIKQYPREAETYRGHTLHGVRFLAEKLWDKEQGGFYWAVNSQGQPDLERKGEKHIYGNAFAIYAAASSYQTTKDPLALDLAKRAFNWIEERAHDKENGGYYEALTREGKPILTTTGSDAIGTRYGQKSMNSNIHLLEALTVLYQVWPDALVKQRLQEVYDIVATKVNAEEGYLHMFLTPAWQATSHEDSYGHDLETAFLLVEAQHTLKNPENEKTLWKTAQRLVDHAHKYGWDTERSGYYDSGPVNGAATHKDKVWWTQAEALNTLLLMHTHFGKQSPHYWQIFLRQWEFIKTKQVDARNKGWYPYLESDGTPQTNRFKSDEWTDPYHQGRAILQVIEMLEHLSK
jgi:cellobiose epimerase